PCAPFAPKRDLSRRLRPLGKAKPRRSSISFVPKFALVRDGVRPIWVGRYERRTSATPPARRSRPTTRTAVMGCCSNPTQPKWSTSSDAIACPARISATSVAAPSFGAVTIEPSTENAPSRPPTQNTHGPSPACSGQPSRAVVSAARNRATAPTKNETNALNTDPPTHSASCALIPNWNGSIAPARSAKSREGQIATLQISRENAGFPARPPRRIHAQLRRHRPARPAQLPLLRAGGARRAARVRVRVDLRLPHPLAGVLRDDAARRGPEVVGQGR